MADSDIVRLTQGQIKMIGDKIKEAQESGGYKTLTTADYDYPETGGKTGIALWNLDNGLYNLPHGVKAYTSIGATVVDYDDTLHTALVLIAKRNQCNITIFADTRYGLYIKNYTTMPSTGIDTSTQSVTPDGDTVLIGRMTQNNLTSTSTTAPLSASQGKVLAERIGDLTTLATTAKTSTVAAINELDSDLDNAIGTQETITISSWSALSASDPYDYQATVSVIATIPANGTVELINDQAVLFATYGFTIGAVDTTNNTVTIYSIGEPTSSVSLKIKVRS